ncbi:MAG TPA: hypothetical protein PKE12_08505 [Kiritimatiellia bacterium]|nr:hypothetical protein [Kiritimatiellia bacterium]
MLNWMLPLFALLFLGAWSAEAGLLRTQQIVLTPGWNAIYLELDPEVTDPAALFAGAPVDVVASYVAPKRGAQFVRNPSASLLSTYGWSVWYAPSRSDAFLTNLRAVYGAKPYLVHATTNATLEITGTVALERPNWTPNAYNFVGFTVASPGAPTFQQFFRGSAAHNHNKIYRLVDGTWRQVLDPGAQVMRAGEAFWIYCEGRSDYPGPLQATASTQKGLMLSSQGGGEVVFRNRTDHPVAFWVEHLTDPANPIPVSTPVLVMDEAAGGLTTLSVHFDADHFSQSFPALAAGRAMRLPLALRVQDAGPGVRHSVLKVASDLGTITYIPVVASRDDL